MLIYNSSSPAFTCLVLLYLICIHIDINECEENIHICGLHGCNNTNGSYECICNNGYELDDTGKACTGNNTSRIIVNGRLSDYATYRKNSLFSVSILDIDECKLEGPVCPVNSNCNNTVGSYNCFCEEGYRNEGYRNKTLCIGNFTI